MTLKDFLTGERAEYLARTSRRCSICRNETIANEIQEYVSGRQDGTILFSIHRIWIEYFGPVHCIGSPQTIRTHIRLHLGVDL